MPPLDLEALAEALAHRKNTRAQQMALAASESARKAWWAEQQAQSSTAKNAAPAKPAA